MPPTLRKRAAPPPEPPAAKKTSASKAKKPSASESKKTSAVKASDDAPANADEKAPAQTVDETPSKDADVGESAAAAAAAEPESAPAASTADEKTTTSAQNGPPKVGDTVTLKGFGGDRITLHDGSATSLAALVDESTAGVVLFTYPKASTPGCTTQACLFRDSYRPLTASGFSIYGLSTDSPTSNTNFKTKQNLPYPLICDPSASLIAAIGLKKGAKGTTRGVFVVDKDGKVLLAEPGSPAGTVEAVKRVLAKTSSSSNEPAKSSL